jgi:hypothetical protein
MRSGENPQQYHGRPVCIFASFRINSTSENPMKQCLLLFLILFLNTSIAGDATVKTAAKAVFIYHFDASKFSSNQVNRVLVLNSDRTIRFKNYVTKKSVVMKCPAKHWNEFIAALNRITFPKEDNRQAYDLSGPPRSSIYVRFESIDFGRLDIFKAPYAADVHKNVMKLVERLQLE